jgi:hypothetical protein
MKPKFVSFVAVLFCSAVFLIVAIFGYSRYKASQLANAAFQQQLQTGAREAVVQPSVAPLPAQ